MLSPSTTAARLYRAAMVALPSDVRRAHGPEMEDAFACMLADRRSEPLRRRIAFAARACSEVFAEGVEERGRRLRQRLPGGSKRRMQTNESNGGAGFGGRPPGMNSGGVGMMISDAIEDLRLAARALVRSPVATLTLIVTLALGIGANTAVFSVLQGVLLTPLPYDEPGELFTVGHELANIDGAGLVGISNPDLLDYIAGTPSIEAMGSVNTLETNLSDDDGAARITIGWVTPDFFPMLGTSTAVGRMLDPSDWTPRTRAQMEDPTFQPPPMPVLISHGLWSGRFGSDPDIVGRDLVINGTSMNVVGVLPSDFRTYLPPEAGVPSRIDAFSYLPIPMTEGPRGGSGGLAVARLAEGATMEQAVAELETVNAQLHEAWPAHGRFGTRISAAPLLDGVVGETSSLLWVLFGAIGLVLLVAVANVANLLLVRAAIRQREFSVRAALGVSRERIVRKVLTESLLIGALGALAGLAIAGIGVQALVSLAPVDIPRLDTVSIDGPVLMFTLFVTVGAAVIFGSAPALASARVDGRSLVSARGQVGADRRGLRLRNGLIVAELALSVVLVAGAGLVLRSFGELTRVDPGYTPQGAVAVEMALPFFTYRDLERRQQFFDELRTRASEIPGVQVAGLSPGLPLTQGSGTWLAPYGIGGVQPQDEQAPRARYRTASIGYFEAIGVSMLGGRGFDAIDVADAGRPGSEVAVVVDRRFAEEAWPDENPVGRTFEVMVAAYIGQGRQATGRVVGVVESIRYESLALADEPTIWVPFDEYAPLEGVLVLRGDAEPGATAGAVRAILADLDPGVPLYEVRTLETDWTRATAVIRYALLLLGVFALTALVLAGVGLYGVVSTTVQQRTREIGVRLALGAEAGGIGRMVLGQGLRLVAGGVLLGIGGALIGAPVLSSLLYQVGPSDPVTLGATALLLAAVALFAGWLPAARASRMDPVDALRAE